MGSSADMQIGIGGAVIIGSVAGAVSTLGYQMVTKYCWKTGVGFQTHNFTFWLQIGPKL